MRLRKGALQAYQSLDGAWPADLADQVMHLEATGGVAILQVVAVNFSYF